MKIIWILIFLLFSCSIGVNASPPNNQEDYLPKKIQVFLDKHFSKFKIEKLKYDAKDGDCKVKYTNGIKIEFGQNGNWEEVESDYIPLPKSIIDILPHPAISFIAKKYPNKPIKKIKHKSDGYKVKLDGSLDILFDSKGNVLKIDD